jgi:hypothetical protein
VAGLAAVAVWGMSVLAVVAQAASKAVEARRKKRVMDESSFRRFVLTP